MCWLPARALAFAPASRARMDVDVAVESLSSLLEPILIISMGIVVGFIVIALFLPLIKIIQNL